MTTPIEPEPVVDGGDAIQIGDYVRCIDDSGLASVSPSYAYLVGDIHDDSHIWIPGCGIYETKRFKKLSARSVEVATQQRKEAC